MPTLVVLPYPIARTARRAKSYVNLRLPIPHMAEIIPMVQNTRNTQFQGNRLNARNYAVANLPVELISIRLNAAH